MPHLRILHVLVAAIACCVLTTACEKTSHESIEKWETTKKGEGKLKDAFTDRSLDPDLSAHAAEVLLRKLEDAYVRTTFEQMESGRRAKVIAKLAPRLWTMARIEGEMTAPSQRQMLAKDVLVDVRPWADDATREQIDGYLTDWLTGGYYEGRAEAGRHTGAQVMRMLGQRAGERLIAEVNRIIAAPDEGGKRRKIGDELMLGLAVSGSPEAVKLLLDIFAMDRGDATLPDRAMAALYRAYLDTGGAYPVAEGKALQPHVARLAEIAKDDGHSPQIANDAVALLRAAGMPHCLEPLIGMVNHPHRNPRFLWVAVNNSLRCGGPAAMARVAEALPTAGPYDHRDLGGATWETFASLGQRDGFIEAARGLLGSRSWVARWIAVETMLVLSAKSEADAVARLAGDKTRLAGYWGDQKDVPKAQRKPEPTLGQRASEVAAKLR
ncbi:MAG: hypothetical protein F9K40_20610 [Kofleriaceae bacterium]|nr:MAG: hypothetical protein F9K40_20610 [Kofleriaceae bacterium]MBZ0235207.1 hypothetical protein [Kofleriaceae bacterium]